MWRQIKHFPLPSPSVGAGKPALLFSSGSLNVPYQDICHRLVIVRLTLLALHEHGFLGHGGEVNRPAPHAVWGPINDV